MTIIDLPSGCDAAHTVQERNNLAAALVAAGNTVTTVTTGVVPADLTGQTQVWDIRCQNVLSGSEITTFTNYLTGGGALFLMGENTGFGAARDASLLGFIATMGGGSLTLTSTANSQTAQPPFTGPNPLTTVTFRAVGGTTTSGTGSFATRDINNFGGSIFFGPGTLSSAPTGRLTIVWDVNFLDGDRSASEATFASNLVAYLGLTTTTTSLLASTANSTFGQAVTFTATVSAVPPGGTPTGTVTFLDGATQIGTGTLNGSGVATLTISTLAVGSHSITASYGGDTTFVGSVSSAAAVTVGAAPVAPTTVPTMGEWGMIIFMLLAGITSYWSIRRQHGA